MAPAHGAIVNWFGHTAGYVNFGPKDGVNDTSTNIFPISVLMLGEDLHNNHHLYGGRRNFALRWFEFDPTYPLILILNSLGIIHFEKNRDEKKPF